MAKIKVHINKPDPSAATIAKYKYASKVKGDVKRMHTYKGLHKMFKRKNKRTMFVIAIILTLLLLILLEAI